MPEESSREERILVNCCICEEQFEVLTDFHYGQLGVLVASEIRNPEAYLICTHCAEELGPEDTVDYFETLLTKINQDTEDQPYSIDNIVKCLFCGEDAEYTEREIAQELAEFRSSEDGRVAFMCWRLCVLCFRELCDCIEEDQQEELQDPVQGDQ